MSTDVIESPESTSAYPQSLAVVVNVCVASSATVIAPPVVVGASLTELTVIVMESVSDPPSSSVVTSRSNRSVCVVISCAGPCYWR